ncbi:MAG: FtsW/RodA/SpoVE family cell cycle protein, partial [Clostridia bacterium]|nr:FtsW/RodA/SpoVE family cell cycle protein [Clostridia bacterium]
MNKKFFIRNKLLVSCAIILSLIGLVMQYSASSYSAQNQFGDAFYYVKKQAIALIFAVILMFAIKFIKTDWLKKWRYPILGISLVLLALVFIPKIGVENYGAKRWLNLGVTTMQPSDVAKFALVIFIAGCLDKKSVLTFKSMIPILLATGAVCLLIMLEPNMSVTMCVGLVVVILLFVGGCRLKHFLIMAIPVALGVV